MKPSTLIWGWLALGVILAGPVRAEVTFQVTVPESTPVDAEVYIAGDFQSWQPGNPDYRLAPSGENQWTISLPLTAGQAIQFKFTLGDWGRVEKGSQGEEIENRLHRVAGGETLELAVAGWAHGESRPSSQTGNIQQIEVPGFLDGRRVWIYLPPGYDTDTDRRYPVLYMMDGQNVFDAATSFAGEWKVDETLEELIPAGRVAPVIVVAVDNGGERRSHEYTPWYSDDRGFGGGGAEHLQAWIDVLLPSINTHYRTLTGPDNTGLAGSSFGGLMTLYGACVHRDVFGRFGSFSPSIMFAGGPLLDLIADQVEPDIILYVDMGTREAGNLQDGDGNGVDDNVDRLRQVGKILHEAGFVGGWDLLVVEGDGDRHNEAYWARRFPAAMEFLFPAQP